MSLRNTDVRTPGAAEIAKKWNLPLRKVYGLISQGAKVEFEHNRDKEKAKQVARDHINERPDYYKRLRSMEKLPIRMKEGLSTEPERDTAPIGDYTGASRKVMKVDEVKISPKIKKAAAVGMTAANIATGASVYDNASRGVGSPIRDIAAAASGLPGKVGYAAMGANYTIKGFDKAKEHLRSKIGKKMQEDWQSVNRKDKTDGLSQKAVDAYKRENPGSNLQTAVTEKNPTGKRASRRKSFCARMGGMKKRLTSAKTARDPDSRINKALRRWNCEESTINELKAETLGSYIKKASASRKKSLEGPKPDIKTWSKRQKGVTTAVKKLTNEETTMDNKEHINEAIDNILENNLSVMKDNFIAALQEKVIVKLEEKKKEIASSYFAQ